jgi:hypothetical protein
MSKTQSITRTTTASIRIALSHNYSTFEVALNLENPDGINTEDVAAARVTAQALANDALNEYKRMPNATIKDEIKKVENKIGEIRRMAVGAIEEEIVKAEPQPTPEEIAKVENMPLYSELKAQAIKHQAPAADETNESKVKAGKTKSKKTESLLDQAINGKI